MPNLRWNANNQNMNEIMWTLFSETSQSTISFEDNINIPLISNHYHGIIMRKTFLLHQN